MNRYLLRTRVTRPVFPLLLASACLLLLPIAGCANDAQQLQQARDAATATLAQAQAVDATLKQEAATRPAADPVNAQERQLATVIAQVQALLPAINAAIASISAGGAIDPALQQALGAIPYGSIALAVVSLIFALTKHVQAGNLATAQQQTQKALDQVVAALGGPGSAPQPTSVADAKAPPAGAEHA